MLQGYDLVVADTSCFILLNKIGEIQLLLKMFGTVSTTPEVAAEYGKTLPDWISIRSYHDSPLFSLLSLQVDIGEASAITLSLESKNALLIVDDNKARRLASKLKLNYTGTLGLILKAKQAGIIPLLKPVLENIQKTNFRLTQDLYDKILAAAGELP